MKKIFILVCAAATMVSCGLLGGATKTSAPQTTTTTTPAATTTTTEQAPALTAAESGKAAGDALQALYKQYKQDGKYDYTNLNNVINTLSLIQYSQGLKNNAKDSDYRKQFSEGLLVSASSLISQDDVDKVTGSLANLVDQYAEKAATATSAAAAKLETAAQTASSIATILAAMGNQQ